MNAPQFSLNCVRGTRIRYIFFKKMAEKSLLNVQYHDDIAKALFKEAIILANQEQMDSPFCPTTAAKLDSLFASTVKGVWLGSKHLGAITAEDVEKPTVEEPQLSETSAENGSKNDKKKRRKLNKDEKAAREQLRKTISSWETYHKALVKRWKNSVVSTTPGATNTRRRTGSVNETMIHELDEAEQREGGNQRGDNNNEGGDALSIIRAIGQNMDQMRGEAVATREAVIAQLDRNNRRSVTATILLNARNRSEAMELLATIEDMDNRHDHRHDQ
jgi:hypothetical protein